MAPKLLVSLWGLSLAHLLPSSQLYPTHWIVIHSIPAGPGGGPPPALLVPWGGGGVCAGGLAGLWVWPWCSWPIAGCQPSSTLMGSALLLCCLLPCAEHPRPRVGSHVCRPPSDCTSAPSGSRNPGSMYLPGVKEPPSQANCRGRPSPAGPLHSCLVSLSSSFRLASTETLRDPQSPWNCSQVSTLCTHIH